MVIMLCRTGAYYLESIPDHPTPSLSNSCCTITRYTELLICGVCVRLLHPTEGVEGKCSAAGSKPRVASFGRRERAGAQVMKPGMNSTVQCH